VRSVECVGRHKNAKIPQPEPLMDLRDHLRFWLLSAAVIIAAVLVAGAGAACVALILYVVAPLLP
jgi:hypothetical protein